jgi:hypothetical protein
MKLFTSFSISNHQQTIPNFRQSRKLKALKGRPIVAQGKCESASAPPWVNHPKSLPPTAKSRDSANLISGSSIVGQFMKGTGEEKFLAI